MSSMTTKSITLIAKLTLLIVSIVFSISAHAQVKLNLTAGWNLMGNSSSAPIDVAATFGDAAKITSVWKWNKTTGKWAFYSPSMSSSALITYAQSKGYDVLSSIESKEGFWANAQTSAALTEPTASGATLTESDPQVGWNLVSSADNKTPSQLNQALGSNLNEVGKAILSAWQWESSSGKWKFYAPSLAILGGTVLDDYIASKGYLPFTNAPTTSDGYWLNIGAVTPTSNTLYYEFKPNAMPDFAQYYNWSGWTTGGVIPAINPVFADVNGDGKVDISIHFWQMQSVFGSITDAPTPNRLVTFTSQPDGTYRDTTAALFGSTDPIILPGGSRKVAVGDLNSDGRQDWVYANNREDGRGRPANINYEGCQSAAIISQPNGTYKVVNVGDAEYYHSVAVVKSGGVEQVWLSAFYAPYIDEFSSQFSYQLNASGNGWVNKVAQPGNPATFVALPPSTPNGLVTQVVTLTSNDIDSFGWPNLVSFNNGMWSVVSKNHPYQTRTVDFVTWQNARLKTPIALVNGQEILDANYWESGLLYPFPNASPVVVMQLGGGTLGALQADGAYHAEGSSPYELLEFYSVTANNTFQPANIKVLGEVTNDYVTFMDFIDVNNDGLQDIVVYPDWYAVPYVYLNTGAGLFTRVDEAVFPQGNEELTGSRFFDANGDGIYDLMYWRSNGGLPNPTVDYTPRLYLGTQASLSMGDTYTDPITITDRMGSTLIHTWAGDDTIVGGCSSTCSIDGGLGVNTINYAGKRANYSITKTATGYTIRDIVGSDGTDNVKNIQILKFSDATIDLRTGNY